MEGLFTSSRPEGVEVGNHCQNYYIWGEGTHLGVDNPTGKGLEDWYLTSLFFSLPIFRWCFPLAETTGSPSIYSIPVCHSEVRTGWRRVERSRGAVDVIQVSPFLLPLGSHAYLLLNWKVCSLHGGHEKSHLLWMISLQSYALPKPEQGNEGTQALLVFLTL